MLDCVSPVQTMTCLQPASLQDLFLHGQSVITRITRLDSEKKRFLGTVRLDECYEGGLEAGLNLLENYLLAREEAVSLLYAERGWYFLSFKKITVLILIV